MKFLSKMIENLTEYRSLRDAAASGALPLCAVGLSLVHKAHLVYALQAETGLPALLLTGDEIEARRLTDDLNVMAGEDIAVLYPYREFAFRDVEASREYEHGRLTALGRLQSGRAKIIVASAIAAAQYTLPPDRLRSATLTLRPATVSSWTTSPSGSSAPAMSGVRRSRASANSPSGAASSTSSRRACPIRCASSSGGMRSTPSRPSTPRPSAGSTPSGRSRCRPPARCSSSPPRRLPGSSARCGRGCGASGPPR